MQKVENKNVVAKSQQKITASVYFTQDAIKNKINQMIGSEKQGQRFVASIMGALATNPELQNCDHSTILSAGMVGESLRLSPSPQLGQYYFVPFNDNKLNRKVAQFQLGYKGYIQLAIRSGQYKKLNVTAIKKGELIKYDPLNEEIEVNLIEDELEREKAETVGYYAMFEYINGFRKTLYWSKEKMQTHAKKYSTGYASDIKKNTNWTFWSKDFDGMAYKTMLRQIISKWGIMSIEMQTALENDGAVIDETGKAEFVDSDYAEVEDIKEVKQEVLHTEEKDENQEIVDDLF